jgi:hypothetical protein
MKFNQRMKHVVWSSQVIKMLMFMFMICIVKETFCQMNIYKKKCNKKSSWTTKVKYDLSFHEACFMLPSDGSIYAGVNLPFTHKYVDDAIQKWKSIR